MTLLNQADAIRLGSSTVSRVYLGSNQVWPSGPVYWEDFETGNRMTSIQEATTSEWARVDDGPPNNFVFNYTNGLVWSTRWDDSITYSASPTFFMEGMVRVRTDGTTLAGLVIAKQAGANNNGYQILIDRRNGTGSSAGFHIRLNRLFSSGNILAFDAGVSIVTNRWYRIQVDWRDSGTRITARLYDTTTDTLISTLTTNNTTYTSGRLGIIGYQETSYDNIIVVP